MLERYVIGVVLFIVATLQYGAWAQLPPIIQHSDYDAMEQHYAGTELGDGSELVRLSMQYTNQPISSLAGCIMDADFHEEEYGVYRFGAVAVFPRANKKVKQSSGSKYTYFNVESEEELGSYDEATLSTRLFNDRCILKQYSTVDISSKNCISARNMTIEVKNPDGHVYTGPRGRFRKELLHTTRAFGQEVGLSSGVLMTILKEENDRCLAKIVRDDNNYTHQGIVFWCSGNDIRNQTTVFNTFLETVKEDAQKVAKALEKVQSDKSSEREMIREIISDTNSTTTSKKNNQSIEDH